MFADDKRLKNIERNGLMASLIFEISTQDYDKAKYLKETPKGEDGNQPEPLTITKKSEWQYKNHAIKFGLWCKENYKCRHFDDCKPHIQDYADFLAVRFRTSAFSLPIWSLCATISQACASMNTSSIKPS